MVGIENEQRPSHKQKEFKLPRISRFGREVGGSMLNLTGLNRFFYICDFHDMRCKHARVLSFIREQLRRELADGDIFIVLSSDHKTVRLYSYNSYYYDLYERNFYCPEEIITSSTL